MKVKSLVISLLGFLFTHMGFAGDGDAWRLMSSLSFGPTWSSPGEKQTLYLQAELPETFVPNSVSKMFANGELFLGLQHSLVHHLKAQFGFAFAGTTGLPLYGDIWQDADPNFNNLSYTYKINHTQIGAKAKFLTDMYQFVQPYLFAGLAFGFNHAYQYSDTPKVFEVLPEPFFTSQTKTAFTYSLGAGVQRALNDHWALGLGYEFSDWGATSLAAAPGQFSGGGLNLKHVYTNELQFNLSFVV